MLSIFCFIGFCLGKSSCRCKSSLLERKLKTLCLRWKKFVTLLNYKKYSIGFIPWTKDKNRTYIRHSKHVLDIFWTSYVRSVPVSSGYRCRFIIPFPHLMMKIWGINCWKFCKLTQFKPLDFLYTPWKHQQTSSLYDFFITRWWIMGLTVAYKFLLTFRRA